MSSLAGFESRYFLPQLTEQLDAVAKTEYPEFTSRRLVPLVSRGGYATTLEFSRRDIAGRARIGADDADDVPTTSSSISKVQYPVKNIQIAATWTYNEMRRAEELNEDIDNQGLLDGRYAIESELDRIGAIGDVETGLYGAANNPAVEAETVAAGAVGLTWPEKTGPEILKDLLDPSVAMRSATRNVAKPTLILLPPTAFSELSSTVYGTSTTFILPVALASQPNVQIVPWDHLETAGAGGGRRMIHMVASPDVLVFSIPVDFEVLEPQTRNFRTYVLMQTRTAGVIVKQPMKMRYTDGF